MPRIANTKILSLSQAKTLLATQEYNVKIRKEQRDPDPEPGNESYSENQGLRTVDLFNPSEYFEEL